MNGDRLTKRHSDGSVGINAFRYYNYQDFQKIAGKLADYEDAAEDGLLIALPFKLGDLLYSIDKETYEIVEHMVLHVIIYGDDTLLETTTGAYLKYSDMGTFLHLSKEKASEARKKLMNT